MLTFFRAAFSTQLWSAAVIYQFSGQASEQPTHVYHYTTADGLKGIIESKRLWASGAYFLNDTSEIEYGCELTARILEESAVAPETEFIGKVLDKARSILMDPIQRETRTATYYVACFCETDNLLSQWRTYGRQGGFAPGFRVADTRHLRSEPMTSTFGKVLYDKAEQLGLIHDLVIKVLSLLKRDDVVRGDASNLSGEDVSYAGQEVAQMLLWGTTFLKAPDFAEEHEWRLICQPRDVDDREKVRAAGQVARFRTSSRGLIPYIELAWPQGPDTIPTLPIDSVRFGPTQTHHMARTATRMFLDANGFQSVQVVGSGIPINV